MPPVFAYRFAISRQVGNPLIIFNTWPAAEGHRDNKKGKLC